MSLPNYIWETSLTAQLNQVRFKYGPGKLSRQGAHIIRQVKVRGCRLAEDGRGRAARVRHMVFAYI